ncbi:aKG-HExxH-type peptide beta-hydroxylase [Archangium sp.]|uniref:aKG-HExxH-type peptide beta-hydroxylase n=1 Tax=Archangium sp. TaxID=1872627 RepID=UPI002D3A26B9|nr:HEXXH motif-containing putative peptide modification protein [Archangium sp.]HYO51190.1 HEXXH motif-containing putative peptide modification protein [Archangium sp.]
MSGWLFSLAAPERLTRLDAAVKRETLRAQGGVAQRYTPWLCAKRGPLVTHIPDGLVTEREHLLHIARLYSSEKDPLDLSRFKLRTPVRLRLDLGTDERALFEEVFALVARDERVFGPLFRALIQNVVPLSGPRGEGFSERQRRLAFSSVLARNAVFMVPHDGPYAALEMVVSLVHEMGHQSLMLLQAVDPLFASAAEAPVYSAIMGIERPAILALHGAVALAAMVRALQLGQAWPELTSAEAQAHIAKRTQQFRAALSETLRALGGCQLTRLGKEVFEELASS